MVTVKSSLAIGSFLKLGTHLWLEILDSDGTKTTFSGHHQRGKLAILKNYKKDFDRACTRGKLIIPPPTGIAEEDWDEMVIQAGDHLLESENKSLFFTSFFPNHRTRGNCSTVISRTIALAGRTIPKHRFFGIYAGLYLKL